MALEKILKNSSGVPTGEYERVAGGTLWADMPVGCIIPFGGTSVMAGFLLCDGRSLLKADYPELYSAIGDAFGSADSTHFNIPDMRESVPKGAGLTGHTVGAHLDADGLAVGEFLDDRIQDHTHYPYEDIEPNVGQYYMITPTTSGSSQEFPSRTGNVQNNYYVGHIHDGRSGATTEVKSVGVNYIIKAKMVALPADLASGVEEYIEEKIESGEATASNGNFNVSFTNTHSSAPKAVILTAFDNTSSSRFTWLKEKTATGFVGRVTNASETPANCNVEWMAIW